MPKRSSKKPRGLDQNQLAFSIVQAPDDPGIR
jgi:hypothetical protein